MAQDDTKFLIEEIKRDKAALAKKEADLKKYERELKDYLLKSTKLSADEGKKLLLDILDRDLKEEKAKKIRAFEDRMKQDSKAIAQEVLLDAMKHGAVSYTAEYTVSSVALPSEEVKGRIIGQGGRNIRAFERATGTELEIDESNEVRISSFDSIRREVAKRSLEKLMKDARIQPARIDEVVKQTKEELEDILVEEGKKITVECGVYNLPTEIIKLIGRYRFRTSYGQNLGIHTIEETKMGVAIAQEIGANIEIVRLGCLLHDIGKVVTDEEGTHVETGVNVLKKHGFPKEVVNCVAEHHEDKPFSSSESVVVWIADAISGSRPGARYEPHENYVERMSKIEEIAKSFQGVETAYAFQAGRDVRVIVKPEEVDDDALTNLAYEIARLLEKQVEYAGQIKVTAIREVRASDTTIAK